MALVFHERLIFALVFRDHPGDFGAISAVLPGRNVWECREYAETRNYDNRLETESLDQRATRMGDPQQLDVTKLPISDIRFKHIPGLLEDPVKTGRHPAVNMPARAVQMVYDTVPITVEINRVHKEMHDHHAIHDVYFAKPDGKQAPTVMARPDLTLLRESCRQTLGLSTDNAIIAWLRSEKVLPIIGEFYSTGLNTPSMYQQLQRLLSNPPFEDDFAAKITLIEQTAAHAAPTAPVSTMKAHRELEKNYPRLHEVIMFCGKIAAKIALAHWVPAGSPLATRYTDHSFRNSRPSLDLYTLGSRVLVTVWKEITLDISRAESGFFTTLVQTSLAGPLHKDVREEWDALYVAE